ncbi:MAG: glycosyltransferase family 2 protein, partial [Burkholderiales bacterium]|nr:glycosyltransferase family 2 protein [Burkholderiales bacterium]
MQLTESPSQNQTRDKIAVLIPCYNESQCIEKVVKDFRKSLPEATIYVYDNNSTDGSPEIVKNLKDPKVKLRHEYRQGKGNVVRSMFRNIEADCYLLVDGDDTYPADEGYKLCEIVQEGRGDMVLGDRLSSTYFTENKRRFHNSGNRLIRYLINTLFNSKVQDILTGYRAFSRAFVKNFPVISKGFEIETEMTIHALDKNFLIASIPVSYRDRPKGSESKLNTYSDGIKVLYTIFTLFKDYRPLLFFGIVGT